MITIPEVLGKNQCCSIGEREWRVAGLIKRAEELEPFDLPLKHIDLTVKYDLSSMRDFCGHIQLILNSDLDSPIILNEDGALMDGRHRIMRAILDGKETVKAVRFETDPPADWIHDS